MILDIIDALPVEDAAQAHAREWAQRVRELQARQVELRERALALFDAGDEAGCNETVAEHSRVSAELMSLCHRQMDVMSRMRPSTETKQ
jgi:alkylhydroperoxidase family enzyme